MSQQSVVLCCDCCFPLTFSNTAYFMKLDIEKSRFVSSLFYFIWNTLLIIKPVGFALKCTDFRYSLFPNVTGCFQKGKKIPQTKKLLLQEDATVSKCKNKNIEKKEDFQILLWSVVSISVLPSCLVSLSVDAPWQTISFAFNSTSLTPLEIKLALKILAGQILPEVLQKVGFDQTSLLVLSWVSILEICILDSVNARIWAHCTLQRLVSQVPHEVFYSSFCCHLSSFHVLYQYSLFLLSLFLVRSIWQKYTNLFRLSAPYSVSL